MDESKYVSVTNCTFDNCVIEIIVRVNRRRIVYHNRIVSSVVSISFAPRLTLI